jgi:hypothetical protein
MRERLLGAGADISSVYFCDDGGTVCHVLGGSVFHWEDLTGRDADVIDNDGGWRAGDVARAAGVSVSDLLDAWRLVQRLQADLGRTLGDVVQAVCPVCGGDDVTADDWEFDGPQSWQSVSCDDCGSYWSDVFALVARENVVRGNRVDVATARQSAPVVSTPGGVADWLDMAYEDKNGCGVEL